MVVLTKDQIDSYEQNGYFVIKNIFSENEAEKYKDRFKAVCRREIPVLGLTVMKDVALSSRNDLPAEGVINKIQDFQEDPVLFSYCTNPKIVEVVSELVSSPNLMAMHTMLINKPPDPGTKTSRHPMHQDLHYFPFRPADRIVCAWSALEPVTRANGCLVVVPGSHRGALLVHQYPEWEGGVNKMYHGIQDYDPSKFRVHLEMNTGDCVFFHPLLIHGSGANTTSRYRKAISCHYAASECHYIDVGGTSQETISDEVLEIARKRLGPDVELTFQDAWKLRARLVRGRQINL